MEEMVFGRRYRTTEKIGAGGMADVYKAVDDVLGRTVAVKVLHAQYASDPAFTQRFRQEAQAAANIANPNIVNIYDWGQDVDTYYIVMEYVRGTDLKEVITERGKLPAAKVADIGAQVCSALAAAHGYDIIHRDIKPHNIMVQPDGAVKVMDFGIARAANSNMTQTGSVLGTAHYVSPEQAQGRPLTMASDLYSLGVVLYEASTGRLPFDADTPVAVALKQVNEEPRPPRTIDPSIPPALEAVILKAMEKNPANRYASADEMRKDLLAISRGESPTIVMGAAAAAGAAAVATPGIGETQVMPAVVSGAAVRQPAVPRKRRNAVWPWVVLAVVLVAAAALAAYALGIIGGKVSVPDVSGEPLSQAGATLTQAHLGVGSVVQTYSASVSAGRVISQDPGPATLVKKNSLVNLVVSRGVQTVIVPDVRGLPEIQAYQRLQKFGLVPTPGKPAFSPTVAQGSVVSQDTPPGTTVPVGTPVVYHVSQGAQKVSVPDVTGKSESGAKSALKAAGFKVSVDTGYSDSVNAGDVISQDPSAGTMLSVGKTVTITVSQGPTTVTVPSVINKTKNVAEQLLADKGLKVNAVSGSAPTTATATGTVYDQNPSAGSTAHRGDTVTIFVQQ